MGGGSALLFVRNMKWLYEIAGIQEVVMKQLGFFFCLATFYFCLSGTVLAQDQGVDPSYQTAPTVTGGTSTGLFLTYSSRTLRRGQFNFGVFWHNFDRDPGDLDINRIPVNFAFGLSDRTEVFVNTNFFQEVTTRQPFLLSGSVFNQRRIAANGDVFAPGPPGFGPPHRDILPRIGTFADTPQGHFVPFGRASYFNDFPFFPNFGPGGPIESAHGVGDVTWGLKHTLIDPDRHFSVAVAGLIKIPTARNFKELAKGRGAGEVDGGPVLILSEQAYGHRLRIHQNIGYTFTRGVHKSDVTVLDRRDELNLSTGMEIAPWDQVVYIAELNGTVYVGAGTPNLNPVNPLDLRLGARFFFFDGRFHIGGAWQTFLTNADTRMGFTVVGSGTTRMVLPVTIKANDANGFVAHIGYGKRPRRIPPPPPNRPPTVNLEADKPSVVDGESVHLLARAVDPDNDVLIYTWSTTAGRIVGSGPTVTLDTAGVNKTAGAPPVQTTASVMVDDGRGGSATASTTITVNSPPPPPPPPNRPPVIDSINYNVIGTPQVEGQITDGETVRITGVAHDPDSDPLTYNWTASAGQLRGTGNQVTLDTTNVTAGPGAPPVNITINLTVNDGRGGTDTRSTTLTVHSVKKPEAEHLQPDLIFRQSSARVDNVHKAILDDVTQRLQQDPRAILVVDGHQDKSERKGLSNRRAENVKRYLVREKGIDASRIVVRDFGANRPHPSGERRMNRRVELWLVPSGADIPK
jgi:outer membrane protein OmpA-like peptidoglycan-associated protein